MDMKAFYDEQLSLLKDADAGALVEQHYAEDAIMVVNSQEEPVIVQGHEALRGLFSNYLENVYRGFVSTEKYVHTDDSIFFEATIDTAFGQLKVYDVLILNADGKIQRHYSGVK